MASPHRTTGKPIRPRAARAPKDELPSPLSTHFARTAIVGAAMEVFAKRGVEATRVEDLLQAAGIARRTFYRYFDNKEDVLAALYEVVTEKLALALMSAQRAGSDPLGNVRLGLEVYFDFHVSQGNLLRVLVEHAVRRESPLFPHRQKFQAALVDILDAAARATNGQTLDPLLYLALIGALETVSLELLMTDAKPKDVERAKRVVWGLLELAIGSPPRELKRLFGSHEHPKKG